MLEHETTRRIRLGRSGRTLVATPVFHAYWRFAAERQAIFHKRVLGQPPPWTTDDVLANHRFTNAYRAADRVSQYLIRNVIYSGERSNPEEAFFRTVLFKIFNKVATWELLQGRVGEICWQSYDRCSYQRALDAALDVGERVYSAAYIMPSPPFGAKRKHANHLRLIELMMEDGLPARIFEAKSLEAVYRLLLGYPSMGPFLAFQLAIDLNYGPLLDFSEMDFVVAGPGARRGVQKCFLDTAGLSAEDVIAATADLAESEFDRQGIAFKDLFGRPLQLIDCQNLFCEVDKYARAVYPEFNGDSGRSRIKQRFNPVARPVPQWYPPKWGIKLPRNKEVRGTQRLLPFENSELLPVSRG